MEITFASFVILLSLSSWVTKLGESKHNLHRVSSVKKWAWTRSVGPLYSEELLYSKFHYLKVSRLTFKNSLNILIKCSKLPHDQFSPTILRRVDKLKNNNRCCLWTKLFHQLLLVSFHSSQNQARTQMCVHLCVSFIIFSFSLTQVQSFVFIFFITASVLLWSSHEYHCSYLPITF